jgi:hypothetical protein
MEDQEQIKGEGVPTTAPPRVRFHYIKSPAFHTIYVDGAIGGPTPSGNLHFALYTERAPIPTQTEHLLIDDRPGPEIPDGRVVLEGIVRELQVDVVLSTSAASGLADWLNKNIRIVESLVAETKRAAASLEAKDPHDESTRK